jgi:DNA-binding transcriptional MerR regulator
MSRSATGADELPNRLYFKIGEVAKLLGVKPYVLRYWETEFSIIRPGKTSARHRLYRRKDVETLLEIRRLLYTERYTIEGAKRRLRITTRTGGPDRHGPVAADPAPVAALTSVREEIRELCRLLEREPPLAVPTLDLVPPRATSTERNDIG